MQCDQAEKLKWLGLIVERLQSFFFIYVASKLSVSIFFYTIDSVHVDNNKISRKFLWVPQSE